MSVNRLFAIDLFCGCGGLTVGLKRARFDVIGAIGIDPISVQTFIANHRGAKIWTRDIGQITIPAVKRVLKLCREELDLLAGCPPCQGFTSLKTLDGSKIIDDPRNDLIFEFQRFVRGLVY